MELEIVNGEKGDYEVKLDDITVAEILRVYLNKQGVDFAAWRREHPDKPITMKIRGKDVKKEVSEAIKAIKKDLDVISKTVKN